MLPKNRIAFSFSRMPSRCLAPAGVRRDGTSARDFAAEELRRCGFGDVVENTRPVAGVDVTFSARDRSGRRWLFDLTGAFTTTRTGLRRSDTLWKALGRAAVLHAELPDVPVVLLTTAAPAPGSAGDRAWRSVGPDAGAGAAVHDVVELGSAEGADRLRRYAGAPPARRRRAAAGPGGGRPRRAR